MITADQLVAHAVGDYLIQSDWMANEKTKRHLAAAVHAITYALPFLFLSPSVPALAVIIGTHFVIDRWRLARFVIAFKNRCFRQGAWSERHEFLIDPATGSPVGRPAWLSVWLLIIADNTLHVLINGAALRWL